MAEGGEPTDGESGLLAWLARRLPAPPDEETWFGDDAAVLRRPSGEQLLFASDCVVAGVHFTLATSSPADVGWKAMSANVSDIAAMGGRPIAAVAAVAGAERSVFEPLYDGLLEAAQLYGCPVVGGDLSAGSELVVSIAVLGTTDTSPVLRSGARADDLLFVTGPLGRSAAGLRRIGLDPGSFGELESAHRRPTARLREGQAAAAGGATAMIDVSDGLGLDLDRLAVASGVGVVLDLAPVAPGATLAEALGGGEDYELVFSAPDRRRIDAAFDSAGVARPTVIGRCVSDPGTRGLNDGPLPISGWLHRIGRT